MLFEITKIVDPVGRSESKFQNEALLLNENEVKYTFFVSRSFLGFPIVDEDIHKIVFRCTPYFTRLQLNFSDNQDDSPVNS